MKCCKRALSAAALLLSLVLLCACAPVNGPEAVVATVDGVPVYRWEVDYMVEKNRGYAAMINMDLDDPEQLRSLMGVFLEQLIEDTALNLYAKEQGYGLTEAEQAEVDEEYRLLKERSVASFAKEHGGDLALGEQAYFDNLTKQHLTEESLLENMYNTAMREKMSADLYASIPGVEEAVMAYYEADLAEDKALYSEDFSQYEQDNASDSLLVLYHPADYVRFKPIYIAVSDEHRQDLLDLMVELSAAKSELAILTMQKGENDYSVLRLKKEIGDKETEYAALRAAGLETVRARAEEALARVKSGADFDELIAEYGDDEGMVGARLEYGYLCSEGTTTFYPEVKAGALSLSDIGDTTDLIESDSGYFILQLVDRIEKGPRPLDDELYGFISNIVSSPGKQDIYNQTAEKAMEGREIVRHADRLK